MIRIASASPLLPECVRDHEHVSAGGSAKPQKPRLCRRVLQIRAVKRLGIEEDGHRVEELCQTSQCPSTRYGNPLKTSCVVRAEERQAAVPARVVPKNIQRTSDAGAAGLGYAVTVRRWRAEGGRISAASVFSPPLMRLL